MNTSVLFDLGALALLGLLAWNGWRAGAVRTLVGVASLLLGLYLAAVGRAPLTALISAALPDVDPLLIGAFVVVGGTWLVIWIGSRVLGSTLSALLRIVRLGGLDRFLGAFLGIAQGLLIVGGLVFVLDAIRSFGGASGALSTIADSASGSAMATLLRAELFPVVGTLIGGWLPSALRTLLAP